MNIRESILPGIGMKYQIDAASGDRMVIVIHDDGRRELYHFSHEDDEQSISMVTLEDQEARQLAALVGGMVYKPKQLETVEMAFDELTIEWYRIDPHFACIGKSIGELNIRQNSGASVIALMDKKNGKQVNPGSDCILNAEATVVAVGERDQQKRFKQILMNGSG
ncbi:cation:proton antiporter regulatory subunit [Paenibacillus dokdonensis]|uniref:Cation:proton antiporter regulatory subunit n=1 Tax=Paenibacillus dokdonensis TaxID=2567944 RepID=A0ABU6GRQ6_9BACL|nr:cation:proton antiporter regulatory subunit [Paenibacillus dokdonensis]MEC0242446.1 cation:proton antiporter regulatory subunit [Paenibacillus dokdonensis]